MLLVVIVVLLLLALLPFPLCYVYGTEGVSRGGYRGNNDEVVAAGRRCAGKGMGVGLTLL